jgi:hypothetical protein
VVGYQFFISAIQVKFPTAMDACGMNINSMPVLVVEAILPEKASQMRIHN